jgi:hypothetical protein
MSAAISPSYSKSTRRSSRRRTASCTRAERSPGGWPKVEKASMRDARLVAETTRHAGGFDRDFGKILALGISVMAVSATRRAAARQHDRHADHAMARLVVDDAAHILQRDGIVARDARHHRVGVARATMEAAKWLRS